jgi:hypothetical protein
MGPQNLTAIMALQNTQNNTTLIGPQNYTSITTMGPQNYTNSTQSNTISVGLEKKIDDLDNNRKDNNDDEEDSDDDDEDRECLICIENFINPVACKLCGYTFYLLFYFFNFFFIYLFLYKLYVYVLNVKYICFFLSRKYCMECILKWVCENDGGKCPYCRGKFNFQGKYN